MLVRMWRKGNQLDGHAFEQAPGVGMDKEAWRAAAHGVAKSQT